MAMNENAYGSGYERIKRKKRESDYERRSD